MDLDNLRDENYAREENGTLISIVSIEGADNGGN